MNQVDFADKEDLMPRKSISQIMIHSSDGLKKTMNEAENEGVIMDLTY